MAVRQLPRTMRKLVALQLSPKFRDVTSIVEVPVPTPQAGEVLVRNRYLGINASDINYIAGRYDPSIQAPFDCGFEGLGEVMATGQGAPVSVGQAVMYVQNGAFSEYKIVSAKRVIPVPDLNAEFVPFLISGLTAAIALDKVGDIKKGETVLVTAAAGGTGQFAVQWAKNAGCHVIGTCSTDDKVQFLKSIGCDLPVNYKKEDLKTVLKQEYSKGVDVVYESIGGEMFDLSVNSLSTHGRLLVIGFISGYETKLGFTPSRTMSTLPVRLLQKSSSVRGFFLEHFRQDWANYAMQLTQLYTSGKLKSSVDQGEQLGTGPFVGLESIADAIDHMYTGKSIGKVVVGLNTDFVASKL